MCALNWCVWEKPDSHSHFWTWSDSWVVGKINVTLRTYAEAKKKANKCSYVCDDGYILTGGVCTPCVPWTWRAVAPDTCTLGSWGYCRIYSGSVYDWSWFPSHAAENWNEIIPISGVDMNLTCIDERNEDRDNWWWNWRYDNKKGWIKTNKRLQPKHSCIFSCEKGYYCTSVSHSVSCKQPECVMWNLGNAYLIGWEPDINTPGLDEYYLQAWYTFVSSVETTGQFNQYIKNNSGCWYRCPEENRYSSGGVVLCYDTWTVAQLKAGAWSSGSWRCLGEENIYGYYWIDDDSRNPEEDTEWTYAPRKTWDGWIEWLKKDGVSCLFTCDNPEDSHEEGLYHLETDLYVETDVEGMRGEIKYSPWTFDCVPNKCGNRDIYTSITGYPEWWTPCHPCKNWTVPYLSWDLYYGLPISCELYVCPRGMKFNESKDACVSQPIKWWKCPVWASLTRKWCVRCIYRWEQPDYETWVCTYRG